MPSGNDLAVTAGWGHSGKGGVGHARQGQAGRRPYDETKLKAIDAEAPARGLSARGCAAAARRDDLRRVSERRGLLAEHPRNVWEYRIGGYQVIKKWLSYREDKILGRALKPEEAREVTNIARRIAAILLLQPALRRQLPSHQSAALSFRIARR